MRARWGERRGGVSHPTRILAGAARRRRGERRGRRERGGRGPAPGTWGALPPLPIKFFVRPFLRSPVFYCARIFVRPFCFARFLSSLVVLFRPFFFFARCFVRPFCFARVFVRPFCFARRFVVRPFFLRLLFCSPRFCFARLLDRLDFFARPPLPFAVVEAFGNLVGPSKPKYGAEQKC